MEAFILAGGKGTRLRSLVNDRPKPMADIGGKPFLEHLLTHYKKKEITHFILSTGYKKEIIKNYFGSNFNGIPVSYAEENNPLGTGGAVLSAKAYLKTDNPFLILNGDTFFNIPISTFSNFHHSSKSKLSMALMRASEGNRFGGVTLNRENKVISPSSFKAKKDDLANGGVYMLDQSIIKSFPNVKIPFSLEKSLLPGLLSKNISIYGIDLTSKFIDIGVPKDYLWCQKNYKEIFL